MVVGAAVSAYAACRQAEHQQNVLEAEAQNAELEAQSAKMVGEQAAANQRMRDAPLLNSFGARAGKMGVEARAGSPLLVELDFGTKSELEAQNQQYGYRLREHQARYGAYLSRYQKSLINPMESAIVTGVSSLASSASSMYGGGGGGTGPQQTTSGATVKPQTGGGLTPPRSISGGFDVQ
jgi:hypothetical protein